MEIPASIRLIRSSYFTDGGTTVLHAVTKTGGACRFCLTQRFFEPPLAGRLPINEQVVNVRSKEDRRILNLLQNAPVELVRPNPTESSKPPIAKDALILSDDIREVL